MIAASWNAAAQYRWSWRRVALALGASLLVHYLVVGSWPVSGGSRPVAPAVPELHAQLDVPVAPLAVAPVETADLPRERSTTESSRVVSAPVTREAQSPASVVTEVQPGAKSGSNVPDPRFFPARELDRYPAPLLALDLRGVGSAVGLVRAWVSVDLAGNVVDVAVVDADPSGVLPRQVREQLLNTQFLPGIKDERPVRSRILLELVYGQ